MPLRQSLVAVLAAGALLMSGGCSGAEPAAGGTSTAATRAALEMPIAPERNDVDVAYAHVLGAMHDQAIAMVNMLAERDVPDGTRALAAEIGLNRSREAQRLEELLGTWRVAPHPPDFHGYPGEFTKDELAGLAALEGEEFQRRWAEMMVANHETSLAISVEEVDAGLNVAARALARDLAKLLERQIEDLEDVAAG